MWFVAAPADDSYEGTLEQACDGTSLMLGMLPTGRITPESDAPRSISVFWSVRLDTVESLRAAGLAAFKREVAALSSRAGALADQLTDWQQVVTAPYHDVVMRPWHTGRVVYLGDAGHAMSPQLGMGANLALEDSLAIAACLRTHKTLDEALAAYSRLQRRHLAYYQGASRLLTPLFQSSLNWLAPLRDILLPAACRLPVFRGQMLHTLAGTKTGWLTWSALPKIGAGRGSSPPTRS
jgi:2-polyprenyl-6-methoxyphenol hydroxylase-like FAD-dependent oxidoreductase